MTEYIPAYSQKDSSLLFPHLFGKIVQNDIVIDNKWNESGAFFFNCFSEKICKTRRFIPHFYSKSLSLVAIARIS
jgi:hypothetical protein